MMMMMIIIIISEFISHDVHTNAQVKLLCIIIGIFIHYSFCISNFVLPAYRPKFSAVNRDIQRLSRSCINNTYDLDRNGQPIC